jgi:hypothetical protein
VAQVSDDHWRVTDRPGEPVSVIVEEGHLAPLTAGDGWRVRPYPDGELITVVAGAPILRGTPKQVRGWSGLVLMGEPVTISRGET